MAKKKRAGELVNEELDLIPVMNLSGQLIALLLVTTTFISYSIINVNAPRFNVNAQQQPDPTKQP